MNDMFEKKLKEFLPYIIIIGALYLIMPAIMVLCKTGVVFNQIVYIGVFPIAALLCSFHYGYKKTNDFYLSLVAPIIYIPSMLLYGNLRANPLNSIIFLISYFICGYIGLTLGEMFSSKDDSDNEEKSTKSKREPHTRKRVPKRVKTTEHQHRFKSDVFDDEIKMPEKFEYDSEVTDNLFEDSTQDDIDAILQDIHNRNDF